MDTNVKIIIKIAKYITAKDPRSLYLFSGLLFEAEDRVNKLNDMDAISAITWLCHNSAYINKLGCCNREKNALERIMMEEFSQL